MLSLVPKVALHASGEASTCVVELEHPRTGLASQFILKTETDSASQKFPTLFEVQLLNRGTVSNGSFLVEPSWLVQNTDLVLFSQVDPFLILLGPLLRASPPEGQFVDYIDCMNAMIDFASNSAGVKAGLTQLLRVINNNANWQKKFQSCIATHLADSRSVMDRTLIRMNFDKVDTYLQALVNRLVSVQDDLSLAESASSTHLVALELVKAYIPDSLGVRLVQKLGYDSKIFFQNDEQQPNQGAAVGAGEKRPLSSATSQQSSKKMKEIPIAKNCMKMTSFFKPRGT